MKILIFGAGGFGKIYKKTIRKENIVAFTDNNTNLIGGVIDSIPVIAPQEIHKYSFDKIVIATLNEQWSHEILNQLDGYGIEKEKIEALFNSNFNPYNESTDLRIIWLRNYSFYVYAKNIPGNVAECGVYRGWFSRYINKFFHDRKLYLFDTFDGFDAGDLNVEKGFESETFLQSIFTNENIFKETNIDIVMRQMIHADNCIIKKGYFPHSAVDVRDTFCFVNLDMDLYQPMFAALKFFWDKMSPGGIILLHDYFNIKLKGVEKAVYDFENELQENISKIPIGDFSSIALIKN